MNIEIPADRSRIPVALLIGTPFTVFFVYLFINDDGTLPFFYYRAFYGVLSGYGLLVIIISFLDYMKTLFDKNARLVLTDRVLDDNLSILSCGPVPWEEIIGVAVKKTRRFNLLFIVITVSDNEKWLKNKNPVVRYILKRYIRIYGGIMVISQKRIDYSIQSLKQNIMERGIPNQD